MLSAALTRAELIADMRNVAELIHGMAAR